MGGGRLATRMGYREFSGSAAASVQQLPLPRIRHPLPPSHPFLPSLYSKSFSSSCQCGGNAWMVVVAVVRVPLMVGAGRRRKKRWKEGGEKRERTTPPKKRSPGKRDLRPPEWRERVKSGKERWIMICCCFGQASSSGNGGRVVASAVSGE